MLPRSVYIYSFHMPLFFFLSGFVHKDKPFRQFFISKVNKLYIPYALFTVLSWLFYLIRYMLYGKYSEISEHFVKLTSIITGTADNGGNNPIWFLTCIFSVSIAFVFLSRIRNSKAVLCIVGGLSLIGYWLSLTDVSLFFNIDIAFTGIVFYYIGYIVKQHGILHHLDRLKWGTLVATVALAESLHVYTAYLNTRIAEIDRVNMAGNLLGNFSLFYISAFLGIFVFVTLGYRIHNFKAFNFLGMNSLLILATHKPMLLILNTYLGRYLDIPNKLYGLIASVIVLTLTVPLIFFVNRKIPQIIGKQPLFQWSLPPHWIHKQKYLPN